MHPAPRRRLIAAVVALSLAALATACSPAEPAATFPTASPVTSATSSNTASPRHVPNKTSFSSPSRSPIATPSRPSEAPGPATTVLVSPPGREYFQGEREALEVVQQYATQLRSSLTTGSSEGLRRLSGPECQQCAQDANLIDQRIKEGRRFVNLDGSEGYRRLAVGPRGRSGSMVVVNLEITDSPNRFIDGSGKTLRLNSSPVTFSFTCLVRNERSQTLISSISLVDRIG